MARRVITAAAVPGCGRPGREFTSAGGRRSVSAKRFPSSPSGLCVVFEAGAVEDVPVGPGAVEELVRKAEVDAAGGL